MSRPAPWVDWPRWQYLKGIVAQVLLYHLYETFWMSARKKISLTSLLPMLVPLPHDGQQEKCEGCHRHYPCPHGLTLLSSSCFFCCYLCAMWDVFLFSLHCCCRCVVVVVMLLLCCWCWDLTVFSGEADSLAATLVIIINDQSFTPGFHDKTTWYWVGATWHCSRASWYRTVTLGFHGGTTWYRVRTTWYHIMSQWVSDHHTWVPWWNHMIPCGKMLKMCRMMFKATWHCSCCTNPYQEKHAIPLVVKKFV